MNFKVYYKYVPIIIKKLARRKFDRRVNYAISHPYFAVERSKQRLQLPDFNQLYKVDIFKVEELSFVARAPSRFPLILLSLLKPNLFIRYCNASRAFFSQDQA